MYDDSRQSKHVLLMSSSCLLYTIHTAAYMRCLFPVCTHLIFYVHFLMCATHLFAKHAPACISYIIWAIIAATFFVRAYFLFRFSRARVVSKYMWMEANTVWCQPREFYEHLYDRSTHFVFIYTPPHTRRKILYGRMHATCEHFTREYKTTPKYLCPWSRRGSTPPSRYARRISAARCTTTIPYEDDAVQRFYIKSIARNRPQQ